MFKYSAKYCFLVLIKNKMAEQIKEAFVGLQWGDEGKGKIVDERLVYAHSLNDNKRVVNIRTQGGDNAGHSVFIRTDQGLVKFVTHAAPVGLASNSDVAIGPSVAFNPISFVNEVKEAEDKFGYSGRILISERVGILFDYHRQLDAWKEGHNERKVGTTKKGIGPFYMDNANRTTRMTFSDYVSDRFEDRLRQILHEKRNELKAAGVTHGYDAWLIEQHKEAREKLKGHSERLEYRLNEYLRHGHHILIEGAQATNLDVDMGSMPDVTSSHILAGNAFSSLGLPRREFNVYGVEKLYPTRVGEGVLPTLARNGFGEEVARNGGEVGASTGRKRRVGYPDWLVVKRSAMLNEVDGIYIMRADVVQDFDILVSNGYIIDGQRLDEMPLDLSKVEPVYMNQTFRWHLWNGPSDISDPIKVDPALREFRDNYVKQGFMELPQDLRVYTYDHDRYVGCNTVGISIGPARGETVKCLNQKN